MADTPDRVDDAQAREPVDPDPWTVVQTVAAIAGTVGVFIQIAISKVQSNPGYGRTDPTPFHDALSGSVHEAIRNVEALVRFLSRANITPSDALDRPFRYAETTLLIDRLDFGRFKQITGKLIGSLMSVSEYSLLMMGTYPEHSQRIGAELDREIGDFARRINSFMDGEMSNGAVIDECLRLLRVFESVLDRIGGN